MYVHSRDLAVSLGEREGEGREIWKRKGNIQEESLSKLCSSSKRTICVCVFLIGCSLSTNHLLI